MSVVDYQEKLRTKSCALFLKLRFWIPPCAKPVWGERGGTVTKPRGGKEHAQREWLSLQTAGFAQSRSGALVTRGGGDGSESTAPSCLHRGTHVGVKKRCKGQRGHNVKELRQNHPAPECPRGMNLLGTACVTRGVPKSPSLPQPESCPILLTAPATIASIPASPDGGASSLPPAPLQPPPYPRTGCWGRSFQFHELHVEN